MLPVAAHCFSFLLLPAHASRHRRDILERSWETIRRVRGHLNPLDRRRNCLRDSQGPLPLFAHGSICAQSYVDGRLNKKRFAGKLKNIKMELDIDPELPNTCIADRDRACQVICNLVSPPPQASTAAASFPALVDLDAIACFLITRFARPVPLLTARPTSVGRSRTQCASSPLGPDLCACGRSTFRKARCLL